MLYQLSYPAAPLASPPGVENVIVTKIRPATSGYCRRSALGPLSFCPKMPITPKRLILPRNVWLLSIASLLNDIASEMIYPLLPAFLTVTLGGSKSFLGLIEGVADSTASLLKLWSGHWSDRLGQRRGLIVAGYLLTVVSRPLVGLATAPWHVLATRFADRVGKGVRTAPRDAMIADSTPADQHGQAFGFHRAMDHAGAVIGPALGAWFLFYWPEETRTLFLLTIVPGIMVVALLYFGLREAPREPVEPTQVVAPPKSFSPAFNRYLIATGVFTLGGASDAFMLLRASELGIVIKQIPLLWIGYHIVKSVGNILCGGLVDRVGARVLLIGGWLLHAGVLAGLALATQPWHACVGFAIMAVFYALTEPAQRKFVGQLAPKDVAGAAFGRFHFVIGITALPASVIFGKLYDVGGAMVAFSYAATLSVLAIAVLSTIRSRAAKA